MNITDNDHIRWLKNELKCPFGHRCLKSNLIWEDNLTPFAGIDLIQCLFNSKECTNRLNYGYTYLCNCEMMQYFLEEKQKNKIV